MYAFSKNNKTWTCPDSGLVTVARIHADDETDKELIINEISAQKYLEYKGFEVKHIDEV